MSTEETIHNRFGHIHQVVSSESFREMSALGGEIPFWIAPYDVKHEALVLKNIEGLCSKLRNEGIKPLLIDIFELCTAIVEEEIGLDKMFKVEEKKRKDKFKRALQSVTNLHERLVPRIAARAEEDNYQVLMIKGVGTAYPFVRSHTILNNLQSAITDMPTLMFFPGEYSGQSLKLFGQLTDDNYYRAFNIHEYKL